jgi:hypothetical protein
MSADLDLFTAADLRQLAALGIAPGEAARQIELFRNQPPATHIVRPCRVGDGIRLLDLGEHPALLATFAAAAAQGRIGKFVPASGAATRMFQALLAHHGSESTEMTGEVRTFYENLHRFPFQADRIAELADKPKGLLEFHRDGDTARTAFEEHLVEAAAYTRDQGGICRLHFTVSPQHDDGFSSLLAEVRASYEERFGCHFEVTFSHQGRATDTLAVDPGNQPFRQNDGTLLFRPGGHGSLIENLQSLAEAGWDVVLIKNIDNVVPDSRKATGLLWKKLLAGALLAVQSRLFNYLERLEAGSAPPELLAEVERFLTADLNRPPAALPASREERQQALIRLLDRPLRVCGVVRNQGEPGGGPFWVQAPDGSLSIQIVETSQIDPTSPEQQAILRSSTHFNPVDLACALRDRHGRPYDLARFVDPSTVFISSKSHEGRPLKALERPGLWNGAMAGWNTVFIEVPDETFAPVKTVLDLLRPEHQG